MRRRIKTESMRVGLRLAVGLMMSLFVLVLSNAQNVEGSHSHKGRFHKAKPLPCGYTITTHAVLYNDLDCSDHSGGPALTLGEGASLNLHGKRVIGNNGINCIDITGDGSKVWNGTVMNCYYGIRVTSNRNEITQVGVHDNGRAGIYIEGGNNNKIDNSIVQNNGREGINIDTGSDNEGGKSNKIDRTIILNNGREGIKIDTGEGNEISRTIVDNNGRQGIHIEGGNSNKIDRTIVDNNGRHGIQIDGGENNEISRSTVRGSCRDGIEIQGNNNLVFHNNVEDNGNLETCTNFTENYNPWAYAGIDVADVVSYSENNKIKYNYACGNQGCNGSEDEPCVARDRNLWDEYVDIDGNHVLTNEWKNNTVCPEYSPSSL